MPGRAFRFGLVARTLAPGEAWADKARRAEQLGYAVLTMPDHFRNQLGAVPALTAAALATTRLRVGSRSSSRWTSTIRPSSRARSRRWTSLLGRALRARPGRGLAARGIRGGLGIRYDTAGTRIERLAEAVTIIKRLLTGERVTFAGRHYTITGLEGQPGEQAAAAAHPDRGRRPAHAHPRRTGGRHRRARPARANGRRRARVGRLRRRRAPWRRSRGCARQRGRASPRSS